MNRCGCWGKRGNNVNIIAVVEVLVVQRSVFWNQERGVARGTVVINSYIEWSGALADVKSRTEFTFEIIYYIVGGA